MGTYTENADKVGLAESVIESLAIESLAQRKDKPDMVTTSQVRKFLTAVNTVTGKIEQYRNEHGQAETLSPELAVQVKFLKVKLAYQVGRGDQKIKSFAEKADLMAAIESIGNDVKKYEEFARYVEALVAFHKYRGGKD
jgi:CRISPR-associated protein Csm2